MNIVDALSAITGKEMIAIERVDKPMFNVGFINQDGMEDQTQFTTERCCFTELESLFADFCIENQIENDTVVHVEFAGNDDDADDRLPEGYAEIEYDNFESAEAIDGARFDDLNYQRYMER